MEDMARKRIILIYDRGLENTLKDEGKNRAGKRTILIDGRGSENALEVEGKIGLESALFELIDG